MSIRQSLVGKKTLSSNDDIILGCADRDEQMSNKVRIGHQAVFF